MDCTVLFRNMFSLALISCFIKTHPLKEQHTGWGKSGVQKGFSSLAFRKRSNSSCSSPLAARCRIALLSGLSCRVRSGHWSVFSKAVPAHVESSPIPTLALSSVTSTKHMQERWISPAFPFLSPGICLCLKALRSCTWGAGLPQCFCWQS